MRVRDARRDFIDRRLNLAGAAVLEVGAMDTPTYPDRNVRYLDWFSAAELREMHGHSPHRALDRIVDPQYVVKQKLFAAEIPDRFDLLIANHVIEHIADPIRWLAELATLAKPGGSLMLSVPDRRYTFDYLRPVSSAADFLRAHAEDLQKPSRWQMLESIYYHRPIRAEDVWGGRLEEKLETRRFTLDQALAHAARADREYADVHCHVFTTESFEALMSDLAGGEMTPWRLTDVSDVRTGSNEFHALLRVP